MKKMIVRFAARATAAIIGLGVGACSGSNAPQTLPVRDLSVRVSAPSLLPSIPTFQTYTAGSTPGFLSSASAVDVAAGANNSVWFTDSGTPAIGTINSEGTVHEYTGLPHGASPYSIVAEKNGAAWFTDSGRSAVGRITQAGNITEFTSAKISGTTPEGITIGPDRSVWFISVSGTRSFLGRVDHNTGTVNATLLPSTFSPDGSIVADNAGNVWFIALNANKKAVLVERRTDGSLVRSYTDLTTGVDPCCPNRAPKRMTIGPYGNVWFTTLNYEKGTSGPANWVCTVTTSGIKYFEVPNGSISYRVYSSGITTDGANMWISGDDPFEGNGALWSLSTSGATTAYPVPYNAYALAAGDDGNLWFSTRALGQASQIVKAIIK